MPGIQQKGRKEKAIFPPLLFSEGCIHGEMERVVCLPRLARPYFRLACEAFVSTLGNRRVNEAGKGVSNSIHSPVTGW